MENQRLAFIDRAVPVAQRRYASSLKLTERSATKKARCVCLQSARYASSLKVESLNVPAYASSLKVESLNVPAYASSLKATPQKLSRSEERRVGKECRDRWSRNHGEM